MSATQTNLSNCLQVVYKKINQLSSVMWGLGSLIKNKLRSADVGESDGWKKTTNAQVGYGEITKGHMTRTFTLMQNITDLIPQDKRRMLVEPVEEYNMSERSRFLDIGSGFGKPVFHAAIQIGCEAKGIEVVPIRVEFAKNFLKTFNSIKNSDIETKEEIKLTGKRKLIFRANGVKKHKGDTLELRSRNIETYHNTNVSNNKSTKREKKANNQLNNWQKQVTFDEIDASKFKAYRNSRGEDYTHIYSYNKVMTKETIKDVCKILNSTNYKVLSWYFNENETRKCGLKNFMLLDKRPMLTTGGQKFTMYTYVKLKSGARYFG